MVFVIFIPFLKFSLSSYCISYSQCDKQLVFFIRRLGILKKKKKNKNCQKSKNLVLLRDEEKKGGRNKCVVHVR